MPRRKVIDIKRDVSGGRVERYSITLECGHQISGGSRQAGAMTAACFHCGRIALDSSLQTSGNTA